MKNKRQRKKYKKSDQWSVTSKSGFTLVELMVSVAIFSIVLVVAMGAILTILDANRKARTLTEVMYNLNFSIESLTRSIKTGINPGYESNSGKLYVQSIDLENPNLTSFNRERIEYRCANCDGGVDPKKRGFIERSVSYGPWYPITSDFLDIDSWAITVTGADTNSLIQPKTQITIDGNVRINNKISSSFVLQTTVSQRKLNLLGAE